MASFLVFHAIVGRCGAVRAPFQRIAVAMTGGRELAQFLDDNNILNSNYLQLFEFCECVRVLVEFIVKKCCSISGFRVSLTVPLSVQSIMMMDYRFNNNYFDDEWRNDAFYTSMCACVSYRNKFNGKSRRCSAFKFTAHICTAE